MSSIVIIIAVMGIGGCFFALPAFIPPWRRRAQESSTFRYTLMGSLSLIALIAFFFGLTFLVTLSTKMFSVGALCGSDCLRYSYEFEDDAKRDAMLTRELWLLNMAPPPFISENTCFTGDESVCQLAQEIMQLQSNQNVIRSRYLLFLAILIIPVVSCAYLVHYITRDNHKRKPKMQE